MGTSENPSVDYIEEFPITTWVCMRNMIKLDGETGNFQDASSFPTSFTHRGKLKVLRTIPEPFADFQNP